MIETLGMDYCREYGFQVSVSDDKEPEFPLHTHEFHELVVVMKGTGIQIINNKEYPLLAGDVFVLKGNDIHGYKNSRNLQYYNIAYDPDRLIPYEKGMRNIPGYHALFVLEPIYRKQHKFTSKLHLDTRELIEASLLLSRLDLEFRRKAPGFEAMLPACFVELAVYLSRKYSMQKLPARNSFMPLADTIAYIEQNYTNDMSLTALANMAEMTVNHFLRVFKRTFNLSPINYVNQLRIKKACEMLAYRKSSITEIALDTGFSDSNYFSRLFKKVMGISPTEFRENCIQGGNNAEEQ